MVHCCAAYNCTERYKKGGVSFHSFPANQALREKWTKAVRRLNFKPTEHSKLCAKHFTPDCYETTPWSFMKRLKDGAVPTIFQFSPLERKKCQKKSMKKQKESPTERCHEQPNEEIQGVVSSISSCKSPVSRRSPQMTRMKSAKTNEAAEEDFVLSLSMEEEEIEMLNDISFSSVSVNKRETCSVKNSMENVTNGSETCLPAKRSRRKKIFFGDFISEDWINKGKKSLKNRLDVGSVELSSKKQASQPDLNDFSKKQNKQTVQHICEKDSIKSLENLGEISNSSDREIENSNSVQLRIPCNSPSSSKKTSSVEQTNVLLVSTNKKRIRGRARKVLLKDSDEVLQTMPACVIDRTSPAGPCSKSDAHSDGTEVHEVDKSTPSVEQTNIPSKSTIPKKTRGRARKILLDDPNDALLVLPELNISRTSKESCDESKVKASSNSDKKETRVVNWQKKQCNSQNVTLLKETKQSIQVLKNVHSSVENIDTDNRDDLNVNKEKECASKTVLLLPVEVSGKMSCSIEINMENASNVQNNDVGDASSSSQSSSEKIIPVKPTSNDKLSSIMKLNLDKEEEILNQSLSSGKYNKNEKTFKVIATDEDNVTDANTSNNNSLLLPSNENSANMLRPLKRKSYIGDFKAEDLASPEKAAKCLNVAQNIIKEKDKRIKYLRQRERRLMKKVEELENVIFHLVEKKVNPEEASTVLIVLKDKD